MATMSNKESLERAQLSAKRVREREAKEKKEAKKAADKEKNRFRFPSLFPKIPKTTPPIDGGIGDLPIEEQLKEIALQKKIKKAEEEARDLSGGRRPKGLKDGGMVTTCRGQGRVMKKRQTKMN
jgi:hypothetical protein